MVLGVILMETTDNDSMMLNAIILSEGCMPYDIPELESDSWTPNYDKETLDRVLPEQAGSEDPIAECYSVGFNR
ncbi:hypothetical protein GOV11_03450 [Candidatus Woesearchaeota archaeon]|nr:hypothetical protein [Candidatus Woesearchaeota archaeon]